MTPLLVIITEASYYYLGLVLARMPRVPGNRGFLRSYCLVPADYGRSVNPIPTRGQIIPTTLLQRRRRRGARALAR